MLFLFKGVRKSLLREAALFFDIIVAISSLCTEAAIAVVWIV